MTSYVGGGNIGQSVVIHQIFHSNHSTKMNHKVLLVLKPIVNYTIPIVGIKMTKYLINLFPKAIYKNDKISVKTTCYLRNHR